MSNENTPLPPVNADRPWDGIYVVCPFDPVFGDGYLITSEARRMTRADLVLVASAAGFDLVPSPTTAEDLAASSQRLRTERDHYRDRYLEEFKARAEESATANAVAKGYADAILTHLAGLGFSTPVVGYLNEGGLGLAKAQLLSARCSIKADRGRITELAEQLDTAKQDHAAELSASWETDSGAALARIAELEKELAEATERNEADWAEEVSKIGQTTIGYLEHEVAIMRPVLKALTDYSNSRMLGNFTVVRKALAAYLLETRHELYEHELAKAFEDCEPQPAEQSYAAAFSRGSLNRLQDDPASWCDAAAAPAAALTALHAPSPVTAPPTPIPALLTCPACYERHIYEGEFATRPHHTHACQHCGMVWRPMLVPSVGVQFLPGFKND